MSSARRIFAGEIRHARDIRCGAADGSGPHPAYSAGKYNTKKETTMQHTHCPYPPCRFGPLQLRNPFVFLPFATGYADKDGLATPTMIRHYRRFAASGVGLVVVEAAFLRQAAQPYAFQAFDETHLPGLKSIVDAIHEEGALASIQICHPGRFSFAPGGYAPSAVAPFGNPEMMPTPLTEAQIQTIIASFADSADIVRRAGFDAVELHGATGYLLASFTSPLTNKRTDAYGGSLEKRMRFPLDVCRAVRARVGDFPVGYRLMAREFVEGGLSLEDGVTIAAHIAETLDPAYISVTAGMYECWAMLAESGGKAPAGYMLEEAAAVKKRLPHVPVIAAGQLYSPEACAQALYVAEVEGIGLARPLFADIDLVRKLCGEDISPVRVCKQCNFCQNCLGADKPVSCSMWTKDERAQWLEGLPKSKGG